MPRVSVIIPTYRRPGLLSAAIQSVLNQTYQDFEILVVDDASGDGTESTVRGFDDKRVRYMVHTTNRRIAAARNTGFLNSTGEFIAFLDDDDQWLPEKLGRQVELFDRSSPTTGVVYTGFQTIDRMSGRTLGFYAPTARGHILHELCRRNCVGTASTVVFRRECLARVGLFDETVEFGEEYDMYIRVAHTYDFGCLSDPLILFGAHSQRMSRDYSVNIRGLERQLSKYASFFAIYPRDHSRRYRALAVLLCLGGQRRKGYQAFLRALRIAPFSLRSYAHLGLSFLGKRALRRLRPG